MPNIFVKVCISEEERDFLDREAQRLDCSRSSLMRRLVFSKAPLPSPPVPDPRVPEPPTKAVTKFEKPVGRAPIDRAIAKVNRDYDVPRQQVEPLVCAVVNAITNG
jgi:hypothetical protein